MGTTGARTQYRRTQQIDYMVQLTTRYQQKTRIPKGRYQGNCQSLNDHIAKTQYSTRTQ